MIYVRCIVYRNACVRQRPCLLGHFVHLGGLGSVEDYRARCHDVARLDLVEFQNVLNQNGFFGQNAALFSTQVGDAMHLGFRCYGFVSAPHLLCKSLSQPHRGP